MYRSILLLSFTMAYCGNVIASDTDEDMDSLSSNFQGTQLYGRCPGAPRKGILKPHVRRDVRRGQTHQRNVCKNLALNFQAMRANMPIDNGDIEDLARNSTALRHSTALLNSFINHNDSEIAALLAPSTGGIPTFAIPTAMIVPLQIPLRDVTVNNRATNQSAIFSSSAAFKPFFKNQ